jgi:CBS domain-containing membrane protein
MTPSEANVAAVMTEKPIVIEADQPLEVAARVMARSSIRHLPVVEDGELVGLVSQRDLLGAQDGDTFVRDVMTRQCAVTRPDESACEAARAILDLKVGCLPVIDDGKLVGIVTETDFVRVAYAVLSAVSSSVARARKTKRAPAKAKPRRRRVARK